MSDAVMVPRGQLVTLCQSLALNSLLPGEGETLINCWIKAHDAASTPVGGWEEPVAWRGEADGIDECTVRPDTRDDWIRYGRKITPLYAAPPPPSVSIDNGSRPQEAVPTEQAVPPVVDCWKVGDYAERIEDHPLVKAGEVHEVVKMYRGGYLGFPRPVGGEWNPNGWRKVATPQPADGSSNEGAGE